MPVVPYARPRRILPQSLRAWPRFMDRSVPGRRWPVIVVMGLRFPLCVAMALLLHRAPAAGGQVEHAVAVRSDLNGVFRGDVAAAHGEDLNEFAAQLLVGGGAGHRGKPGKEDGGAVAHLRIGFALEPAICRTAATLLTGRGSPAVELVHGVEGARRVVVTVDDRLRVLADLGPRGVIPNEGFDGDGVWRDGCVDGAHSYAFDARVVLDHIVLSGCDYGGVVDLKHHTASCSDRRLCERDSPRPEPFQ